MVPTHFRLSVFFLSDTWTVEKRERARSIIDVTAFERQLREKLDGCYPRPVAWGTGDGFESIQLYDSSFGYYCERDDAILDWEFDVRAAMKILTEIMQDTAAARDRLNEDGVFVLVVIQAAAAREQHLADWWNGAPLELWKSQGDIAIKLFTEECFMNGSPSWKNRSAQDEHAILRSELLDNEKS